jgi:hypothetical protein
MPLVEGEWKLFIDKKEVPLKIMDLDNKGHIQCTMENWVVYGGAAPLLGDGFWNELGKQITFKADQENHCKLVISNEHGDEVRQNDNDNHLTCQNLAQNAKSDASIDGNPFSGSN